MDEEENGYQDTGAGEDVGTTAAEVSSQYGEGDAGADGGHYGEDAAAAHGEAGFHPLDAAGHLMHAAADVQSEVVEGAEAAGDVFLRDQEGVIQHMNASDAYQHDEVNQEHDAAHDLGF